MNRSFINRPPLYTMYQIIASQKERRVKEKGGRRKRDGKGGVEVGRGGAIGREE